MEEIAELWSNVCVKKLFEQLLQCDECVSAVDYFFWLRSWSVFATGLKRVPHSANDRSRRRIVKETNKTFSFVNWNGSFQNRDAP